MKKVFLISNEKSKEIVKAEVSDLSLNNQYTVTISDSKRTLEQNSVQWPILKAFSDQLLWPVNGEMSHLSAEEWKDILTAAFRKETSARLATGLYGGIVMLGQRTSTFSKKEFCEWIEFLNSVADDRGIKIPVSKKISLYYGCY